MMMTEGLDYLSVRVCRTDGKGKNLLEGSGTLFEDNGLYYVMTAYHCLSKKDNKVDIAEDLKLTNITFRYNRKDVKVDILYMVDKNPITDWALISVEKPSVDWTYEGKLKLTTNINVGAIYESYPYLSVNEGKGRYTEVIPLNKEGTCHVSGDISTSRYGVDDVLQGGSGAGIMRNVNRILYCFGFMRKTKPQGLLNDIESVCVDDIIPLLSKNAHKSFTKDEIQKANAESKKQQLDFYSEQLNQSKDSESLKAVVTQLLNATIPAMIDSLQDEQALALLKLVDNNSVNLFEEDAKLKALCLFDYSQYYRLIQDVDKAREYSHKAYELDDTNPKYVEPEARKLWFERDYESAKALLNTLPEENLFRLAVEVYDSENQQESFLALKEKYRQNYKFRYYLLDLYNGYGYPRWIVEGIELKEPETLSLSLLPDWVFFFTCVHYRMQGIIPLSFDAYMPPKVLQMGFDAGWRYFELAKGTKLEKAIPMLSALYFYWGFLLKNKKEEWYKEFMNVTIQEDNDINRKFYAIMQSSMLSMMGKYDDAYTNIVSKGLTPDVLMWSLVAGLSCVSQDIKYLYGLNEYSKKFDFEIDSQISEVLVQVAEFLAIEAACPFIEDLKFQKDYEKRLLLDYNKLSNNESVSIDGYDGFIDQLTGVLTAVAATIMFHVGDKDDALKYLKMTFKDGDGSRNEKTYYHLLSSDPARQKEYYLYLEDKRNKDIPLTPIEQRYEYNYALTLQDFEKALGFIEIIWEENKNDEYAFSAYVDLLGKCRPMDLMMVYDVVLEFPFKLYASIELVYLAFATNQFLFQAAEILYVHTDRLKDDALNAYYIQQTIMGYIREIATTVEDIVSESNYVSYIINEHESFCRMVSPGTILGAALIGRKKGETIELVLSGEHKQIRIQNIYNKYGYLHYNIFRNIMEMGGNDYLHPLKAPKNDSPEALSDFLRQLEILNSEGVSAYEKTLEKYYKGEVGLYALVNEDDVLSGYYKLLFSSFELRLKPYTDYLRTKEILFRINHRTLLDITSLLQLFEFSCLKGGFKYKERFLLPRIIYNMVVAFQKTIPVLTNLDFFKAMEEGCLHQFSNNPRENIELRIQTLIDWIEQNCDIVTNPTLLNVNQPFKQNMNVLLFQHVIIELMTSEPRLLLTEDYYMERLMTISLPMVSTETYIYVVEGEAKGKEFTDFLMRNHNKYVS
jgi:hypothetical protein